MSDDSLCVWLEVAFPLSQFFMKKLLCSLAIASSLPLAVVPASAQISAFPLVDLACYQIQESGLIVDLELVCNPDAISEAAEQAELEAEINRAIASGAPAYCSFVEEGIRYFEDSDGRYKVAIPSVCTALEDLDNFTVFMQLKQGNRILGETTKSLTMAIEGDSFTFDADFFGEFAPAQLRNLRVLYRVQ